MAQAEAYMLRTIPMGVDLDGYVFLDRAHAVRWLQQPFVTDATYRVAIGTRTHGKRPCRQCGYRAERFVPQRWVSVSEFLQQYADMEGV